MATNNNNPIPMHANLPVLAGSQSETAGNRASPNHQNSESSNNIIASSSVQHFFTSIDGSNSNNNPTPNNNVTEVTSTSLYGEMVRGKAVSAPPPGFDLHDQIDMRHGTTFASDNVRQRQYRANHATSLLLNSCLNESNTGSSMMGNGNGVSSFPNDVGMRSTSFANLAAALGEGLAESMDDSCKDQKGMVQSLSSNSHVVHTSSSTFQHPHLSQLKNHDHLHNLSHITKTEMSESTGTSRNSPLPQSGPSRAELTNLNNFHRQGRHSASRYVADDNNLYSNNSVLTTEQKDVGIRRHSNQNEFSTSTGGLIDNSTSTGPDRLFQSNSISSSDSIAGVGMTVEEPRDNFIGTAKDKTSLYSDLINRANASTPTSLVQPSSHLSFQHQHQHQHTFEPSTSYSDTTDSQIDSNLAHATDKLLGINSTLDTYYDQSLLTGTHSLLQNTKMKEPGGRASAPPNLYISSSALRERSRTDARKRQFSFNYANALPTQRDLSPKSLDLPPSSHHLVNNLELRQATPSPIPTPEPQLVSFNNSQTSTLSAEHELELAPFLHDVLASKKSGQKTQLSSKPSRGLAILGISHMLAAGKIGIADVRTTCEAFGALQAFRADFASSKGVIFLSYFDLRSAQHAATELGAHLFRFAAVDSGGGGHRQNDFNIRVYYCIPLNSSSSKDESQILISNLPSDTDEDGLASMMESYGEVKAVHYQMISMDQSQSKDSHYHSNDSSEDDNEDEENQSYTVEFFDIQDAKHALMELSSNKPWGKKVKVQIGMTNPTLRRKGTKLLALLGRWRQRHGTLDRTTSFTPPATTPPPPPSLANIGTPTIEPSSTHLHGNGTSISSSASNSTSPLPSGPSPNGLHSKLSPGVSTETHASNGTHPHINRYPSQPPAPTAQTQLLLLPDGQYSYVMINPTVMQNPSDNQVQHVLHPNHLPHYVTTLPVHNHPIATHPPDPRTISQYWPGVPPPPVHQASSYYQAGHLVLPPGALPTSPYLDARLVANPGMHLYANMHSRAQANDGKMNVTAPSSANHRNSAGKKSSNSNSNRQCGDSPEDLKFDIASVKNGNDTRSSLMVKNIPNKYTQQMLLAEFTEFGYGSDKIDFFYLPIDFKNRCNRGYAFINFVDYRDIIPFHEQYNDKQWRVFNSDKVCAITYARIQGKAAMLKRFEHSALLDKNDEYRPLVFTSHGVNKGKRESFLSTPQSVNDS